MSNEVVAKMMRKLAEECVDRSHFVTSADFRRAERIEIETGDGAVIFRSPVHYRNVAVAESPYGLRLYADVPESDLRFLLPGKAYVLIDRPEEGKAYHVPAIKGAERAGKHVLSNTVANQRRFCEVTEALVEVFILRDSIIIEQYNGCAGTLTFRRMLDSLGVIVDYDHALPGDVVVRLSGSRTEVESAELAELLMQYAPVYKLDGDQKRCYGWLAFQRDGESDTFLACEFEEVEDGNRENG